MAGLGARGLFTRNFADRAAETLGDMRGIVAQVGQLGSYVDGLVPDERYQAAMQRLQDAAARTSPEEVAAVLKADLGGAPEELFTRWSPEPLASASLGQVHRATLEGRELAVKVQHPHIDGAV